MRHRIGYTPPSDRLAAAVQECIQSCQWRRTKIVHYKRIIRGGASEECEHLSQGTREQLSVLLRIAFADLLLDQGRPVSLILDDPFVYSDDARLDVMIEILSETAQRMQVILLTCRDRAFRHVPATRLFIGPPL